MATTVAKYTFSSWLRKGIGSRINETDNLGTGSTPVKERPTVPIDVKLNTESVHKDFALLGPGDIIGINPRMVVRTEPLNWITNFEPNYLAFIEFYDEDFLWRYTPARANDKRLRPWLALLVLEEGATPEESEFTKNEKKLPLPTMTVKAPQALPPHDQTWAWGHVHINEGHDTPSEFEQFLLSLHDLDNPNADKIISRLMSPRHLKPNTAYRAFVVPAFETGRLAGLGLPTIDVDAQQPAWTGGSANLELPIYYDWFFRTGEAEDFESLVKLLQPRPIDKRVGIRDMDGSKPGFGMTMGTDIGPMPTPTENPQIIGLEGALKSPQTQSRPPAIDTSKPFFHELSALLNFPAQLRAASNSSTDPVVSPPLYGENHAQQHELILTDNGWQHQLNRDPRNRVPSGFGTGVVQKNQEDYVARAWAQVKKILDANRRIQLAAFAMEAVDAIYLNFISRLKPQDLITVFAPVMKKVRGSPTTLHHQLEESNLPRAAVSTAFRRIVRPRGPRGRKLLEADSTYSHARLIDDLNSGRISPAPPKQIPADILTDKKVADSLPASRLPAWLHFLIRHRLLLLLLVLAVLVFTGLVTGAWGACAAVAALAMAAFVFAGRWARALEAADEIRTPGSILEQLNETAPRGDFTFTVTDPVAPITASGGTQVVTSGDATSSSADAIQFTSVQLYTPTAPGQDSVEARNFRSAALALNKRLSIQAPEKQRAPFDLTIAHQKLSHALKPGVAFPKQLAAQVQFAFDPGWLREPERLVPAMAYPDFDDPMYEKLRDISPELFLPNLNLIPPNTISLLVTNPEFIESYMVGLNHEFGKELLWREYPTDKRGSYFRQFWDVKGIISEAPGLTPEELSERYKDITPLDTWTSTSRLGEHRNPQRPPGKQLVLLVRGELLKKYPNTIIYAQRAHIYRDAEGRPNPAREPVIAQVTTEAEMKSEIRFPIFRAEIDPDIRFFGFDMTVDQARGADSPSKPEDDWGWYFIIQQMPGEPRFGMDVSFAPDEDPSTPLTWDDLSWDKFAADLRFISTATPPTSAFYNQLKPEQRGQWGSHSADMASILYQKPVMIAVHAREMLEDINA